MGSIGRTATFTRPILVLLVLLITGCTTPKVDVTPDNAYVQVANATNNTTIPPNYYVDEAGHLQYNATQAAIVAAPEDKPGDGWGSKIWYYTKKVLTPLKDLFVGVVTKLFGANALWYVIAAIALIVIINVANGVLQGMGWFFVFLLILYALKSVVGG